MPSRRLERINELLLREISQAVLERQHPDMGFVTFMGVSVTEDLFRARVFYSVLGTDDDRCQTAEALESLKGELTRHMRRLESLKRIPTLEFVLDDTPARAARVFDVLGKIHLEEPPHPETGTP